MSFYHTTMNEMISLLRFVEYGGTGMSLILIPEKLSSNDLMLVNKLVAVSTNRDHTRGVNTI